MEPNYMLMKREPKEFPTEGIPQTEHCPVHVHSGKWNMNSPTESSDPDLTTSAASNVGDIYSAKWETNLSTENNSGTSDLTAPVSSKTNAGDSSGNYPAGAAGQDNPLTCKVCGKVFTRKQYLKYHQKRHKGESVHNCQTCGKIFPLPGALEKHMRTHQEKCHKCPVCDKTYTKLFQLKIHQRGHTGEKPSSCSVCGKCFRNPSSMYRHMRIHTGHKAYVCDICSKSFIQKGNRDEHRKVHFKIKKELNENDQFSASDELYKTDGGSVKVEVQDDDDSSKSSLLKATKERKHICNRCDKGFVTKFELKKHMKCKTCQNGDDKCMENCPHCTKPHQCRLCGKVLRSLEALNIHKRNHQQNSGKVMCHVCSKPCRPAYLKTHLRTHDDTFMFICEVCGQGFNQSAGLKRHMRVHTGEKPFLCPVCGKGFAGIDTRKRHLKTHDKEFPIAI